MSGVSGYFNKIAVAPVDRAECISIPSTDSTVERNKKKFPMSSGLPMSVISLNRFCFMTEYVARKLAVTICKIDTDEGRGSVGDCAMGPTKDNELCLTCQRTNYDCTGHMGIVELNRPVINPLCTPMSRWVLESICCCCGWLMLEYDVILKDGLMSLSGSQRLKEIAKKTLTEAKACRNPSCINRKNPKYKFSPDHFSQTTKEIDKETEPLAIEDIVELFTIVDQSKPVIDADGKETPSTLEILGFGDRPYPGSKMRTFRSSPLGFIFFVLPIIPPMARIHNQVGSVRHESYLTQRYKDVIKYNNELGRVKIKPLGAKDQLIEVKTAEKKLSEAISKILNVKDSHSEVAEEKTIRVLLSGKTGAVRGHTMGKRDDFTARSVITPNNLLKFKQVSIPRTMMMVLTIPEVITEYNRAYIRRLYNEGKITHIIPPGLEFRGGRFQVIQTPEGRARHSHLIDKRGTTVFRHSRNGDRLLFNRQPTLHKQGIMAHEVAEWNYQTIGLLSVYTKPYNADHDGDEGNLHMIQTPGGRAEMQEFIGVEHNIMNAQSSKPIMGLVYNSASSAYILTQNHITFDDDEWAIAISRLSTRSQERSKRLPKTSVGGKLVHTGRDLFSIILPVDFYYRAKAFVMEEGSIKEGTLIIENGILKQGFLTSSHIGPASNSIIHYLCKDYPVETVCQFLTEGQWILDWFIERHGLSVGYDSCVASAEIDQKVREKIVEIEMQISAIMSESQGREQTAIEKEHQEVQIINSLSSIKALGNAIMDLRGQTGQANSLLTMCNSGGKGTPDNIAQITGALGQQFVYGARPGLDLGNGPDKRCLPYFSPGSTDIRARGYIVKSFMQGIDPAAMIFHMEASRIGLISTAISTADTGSMHHKINKVFEDMIVPPSGGVCNTNGAIFKFTYSDGFDSAEMIGAKSTLTGDYSGFCDIETTLNKALASGLFD